MFILNQVKPALVKRGQKSSKWVLAEQILNKKLTTLRIISIKNYASKTSSKQEQESTFTQLVKEKDSTEQSNALVLAYAVTNQKRNEEETSWDQNDQEESTGECSCQEEWDTTYAQNTIKLSF